MANSRNSREPPSRGRRRGYANRGDNDARGELNHEPLLLAARGVAHDVKNLLSSILGTVEWVRNGAVTDERTAAGLNQIEEIARSSLLILGQLLPQYARPKAEHPTTDLNQALSNAQNMLRNVLGPRIKLEMSLARNVGRVRLDLGRLQQVLLNLSANGRDAMGDEGALLIETSVGRPGPQRIARYIRPWTEYAVLAVVDHGCGLSEAGRERIFEPFYSTKRDGESCGLGLWTVLNIVQQAGGAVFVKPGWGKGTRFEILLPRATEPWRRDAKRITG